MVGTAVRYWPAMRTPLPIFMRYDARRRPAPMAKVFEKLDAGVGGESLPDGRN